MSTKPDVVAILYQCKGIHDKRWCERGADEIVALREKCHELEEAIRVLAVELVATGPENVADFLQMGSNPIARAAVEKASG